MTKLDLLARAKSLGITGRHDMTKADLETAVKQREMIAQVSEAAKDAASEIKAAKQGKPRTSNLNDPWQRKFYYVNERAYNDAKDAGALAKAPMQVQLMLKFMVQHGITTSRQAQQGSSVAHVMVSSGFVKTVIEPHVLFAYYRSKMERLGLVFAGYNLDSEGEADESDEDAVDEMEADAESQSDEDDENGDEE